MPYRYHLASFFTELVVITVRHSIKIEMHCAAGTSDPSTSTTVFYFLPGGWGAANAGGGPEKRR